MRNSPVNFNMKKSETLDILLQKVTFLALYSRFVVLFLQFFFNLIIPDLENDAFLSPFNDIPKTIADSIVNFLFGGLSRWDAQHYLHVSIYGYVYERSLAFFPGFPIFVKLIATILKLVLFFLNTTSLYLISAICLNIIFFVLAARILFILSYKKLKDENLSYLSCLLFCINPASIFFTAPYSESLFSYISFLSMLCDNLWFSCFFVSVSSLIRSNGLVNIGFPMYYLLKTFSRQRKSFNNLIILLIKTSVILLFCPILFLFYQRYSYFQFCTEFETNYNQEILQLAATNSDILAGQVTSGMCNRTHLPYFYIQNHYWKVGFLEYFVLKQLPNFALAFPMVCFVATQCFKYYLKNIHTTLTLGLRTRKNNIFEYVVHITVLLLVCLFFVHIQVTTRLLCSSSPALYWFGAISLHSKGNRRIRLDFESVTSNLILFYCSSYFVIGTLLFSNHYPWT